MAYLHCHACDWEQDDFWHPDGYTPLRDDKISWLRGYLFRDQVPSLDYDGGTTDELISGPEFAARELEQIIRCIRGMAVRTEEEWGEVKRDWKCPRCGSRDWDID